MRRVFVLYSLQFMFLFGVVKAFAQELMSPINQNTTVFYMCLGEYDNYRSSCQNDCRPGGPRCPDSVVCKDPGACANECMRAAKNMAGSGYPSGMSTDSATYCSNYAYGSDEPDACARAGDPNAPNDLRLKCGSVSQGGTPTPTTTIPQPPQVKPPVKQPAHPYTPTPVVDWKPEANQDIQQCSSLQSTASTCCNNPASCGSSLTSSQKASYAALISQAQQAKNSGNTAGLEEICQRAKSLSLNSSNVNTGFANICYSKRSACTQSCQTAFQKWQQRSSNCGSQCSLVNSTLASLDSKRVQCNSYAQLESKMRAQVSTSADQANLAQICASQTTTLASTDPKVTDNAAGGGGGGGGGMLDQLGQGLTGSTAVLGALDEEAPPPTHEIGAPAEEYCQLNPNAPSCYTAPPFTGEGSSSSVQQAAGDGALSAEDFNVGDNIDSNSGKAYSADGGFEPKPVQGHAVTNGGAGGIPGGGSSVSQSLASNNSEAGQNLPAMLGSGVNPNILHGEGGGGGYSNPVGSAGTGSGFNFKNRYGGFKFPKGAKGKNYKGLDLKKFLPGQRRGLAGLSAFHPDIGPKNVSFFHRVSTRMQALCKLKRLLGCE